MKKTIVLMALAAMFTSAALADEMTWTEIKLEHLDVMEITKLFDGNALPLPTGIQTVLTLSGQKGLLVRGTKTAVQEFTELMSLLDRPLMRVLVECWLMQVNEKDLPAEVVTPATFIETTYIAHVKGEVKALVAALEKEKKGKLLLSTRALQESNTSAPLTWMAMAPNGGISYHLVLTINSDGTVTYGFSASTPEPKLGLSRTALAKPVKGVITLVNGVVRDGGAIALTAPGFEREQGLMLFMRLSLLPGSSVREKR